MRTRAASYAVLSSLLWAWPGLSLAQESTGPAQRTFTLDADFQLGSFNATRAGAPDVDQLRIDTGASVPPFLWVANASAGMVTKVDTRTGRQVARYDSVLTVNWDGSVPAVRPPRDSCNLPALIAVDAQGNGFVLNRGNCSGSSAAITRYAGSLAACVDRNGNGRIDTSSDVSGNGVIDLNNTSEFFGQSDECILWTKNFAAAGDQGRSLVVDADQHLWAAGFGSSKLYRLDGRTGAELQVIDLRAETGVASSIQSLAVGPGGYLYTSDNSTQRLLRKISPSAPEGSHVVDTLTSPVPTFGLVVDRLGRVWLGADSDSASGVVRADFTAHTAQLVGSGGGCTGRTHGVAVDATGDVWAACWSSSRLLRVGGDGTFKNTWFVGTRPEGVSVAADGRIWTVISGSDSVAVVNPAVTSTVQTYSPGGMSLSYGDMTGYHHQRFIARQGTWSAVHDSGTTGASWGAISWNQEPQGGTPTGTRISVGVRAADTSAALASQPFAQVVNGQAFAGIQGRFLEVLATLRSVNYSGDPVLSDLTIFSGNHAPVARCLDQSVCAGPACTAQVSVNNGSYDPDGDAISLAQSPAGAYAIGQRPVSLTVSDGFATDSCSASVSVRDCEAPSITCGPPLQAECTGNESAFVSAGGADATDACSTVSVSGPGLAPYPLGSTSVAYTATDAAGNTAACTTQVQVSDTLPPSITCPAPTTAECVGGGASNSGLGTASAVDVCSPVAVQGPGLASFPLGTATLIWSAADTSGNTASCSSPFTVADTQPPDLMILGPSDQTLECGTSFSDPAAVASDACAGDVSSRVVASGTVDPGTPGLYTRTYLVSDPSGNSAPAVTSTVTVADTLAPRLVLNGEAQASLECGASYVEPGATATDLCAGNLSSAVVVSGAVNAGQPGSYTTTYSVSDSAGNSASPLTRTVSVVDTQAPTLVLNGAASATLECGSAFVEEGATASDVCAGSLTSAVVISGAVDTARPGSYTRSYSVADPSGNAATVMRTVAVTDTQPPSLALNGSAAMALDCGSSFVDPGATAIDACQGNVNSRVTVSGAVDLGQAGSYVLTYGVTDSAGNAAAAVVRTVTVADTEGPVLSLNGLNPMPLECMRDWYAEPGATAMDACSGDLSGAISIEHGYIDSAWLGTYPVTYRAADSGGNVATAVREVRVQDTLAPELYLNGATSVTLECKVSTFSDPGAVAQDVCSGNLTSAITVSGTVNTNATGAYPLSYRVQDGLGLVTEKVREVRVVDTRPPTITLEGSSTPVMECSREGFIALGASAADLCAGDITHRITISGTEHIVAPGTYPITYNVTDPSGNAAESVTRSVTVRDTQAPVVTILGEANMTLECGVDTYTELGATAYDACQGDMTAQLNTYGNGANAGAVGTYSIQYGVWDSSGNTTMALRTVKVVDRLPPSLSLVGSSTVQHECASGPYVDPGATGSDACYGDLTRSVTTTGFVNAWTRGTYTLTYNVQDSTLLKATPLTRTVQVVDTQAPTLEYRGVAVSPADHTLRSFSLADCVTASDTCDGYALANNGTILSIYSDEPEDVPGGSDGNTLEDIVITGRNSFKLRAERQRDGDGRVYGVAFELKDQRGNVRSGLCQIRVPANEVGTANDSGSGSGYTVAAPPLAPLASLTAP